eukprot:UN08137
MGNISVGGKMGSSIGAAYLEKFIDKRREFVHLDIAGSSAIDNIATGATLPTLQAIIAKY